MVDYDALRKQQTAIVKGSMQNIAEREGKPLAELFVGAKLIIIFDSSGSMSAHDSRGGKSRFDIALEELRELQAQNPGEIAIINFSGEVEFVPGGAPQFMGGGTNLAAALRFAQRADKIKDMGFVVVSDGEPDDETEALSVARTYKNRINTIYCGPESGRAGRAFLEELAKSSGGVFNNIPLLRESLSSAVNQLILTTDKK